MNSEKIQILVEGMEKKTKQKLIFIEMLEYFGKLIWLNFSGKNCSHYSLSVIEFKKPHV